MPVSLELHFDSIRIYVNGVLHLSLKRSKLLAVQAWRWSAKDCAIEYVMQGNTVLTEYDDEQKWKAVLDALNACKFI